MADDKKPDPNAFNFERFEKLHKESKLLESTIDAIYDEMHVKALPSLKNDKGLVDWSKLNTDAGREAYIKAAMDHATEATSKYLQVKLDSVDPEFAKSMSLYNFLGLTEHQFRDTLNSYRSNWETMRDRVIPQIAERAKENYRAVPRGMIKETHLEQIIKKTVTEDMHKKVLLKDTSQAYDILSRYIEMGSPMGKNYLEKTPYYK